MKKLSFPTVKLGNCICEVKEKVKNSGISQDDFTVYGVTNTDGITVTNNKASDDLGNYTVLRENQFAYNPYRVNVGSIGLSLPGTFGAVSPAYVAVSYTHLYVYKIQTYNYAHLFPSKQAEMADKLNMERGN